MSKALVSEIELTAVVCFSCGVPLWISEGLERQLRRSGRTFYCPNGHGQVFGNSVEEQLEAVKTAAAATKKELEKIKSELTAERQYGIEVYHEKEAVKRQLATTKGVLTRTRNRIKNGTCPCCNRNFVDLHRHMSTQHPNFTAEGEEATT